MFSILQSLMFQTHRSSHTTSGHNSQQHKPPLHTPEPHGLPWTLRWSTLALAQPGKDLASIQFIWEAVLDLAWSKSATHTESALGSLPTQPSPSGLRAMPGGQMHMKVPIRFLHIMPRDSQSCSPSAHSSRSRRHLLKQVSRGKKKVEITHSVQWAICQ